MTQALPRFCPQCGTSTWANMHHCATCGLTVEAMLREQSSKEALPDEGEDAALLETKPEIILPEIEDPASLETRAEISLPGAEEDPAALETRAEIARVVPTTNSPQTEDQPYSPPPTSAGKDLAEEATLMTPLAPAPQNPQRSWSAPRRTTINPASNPGNPVWNPPSPQTFPPTTQEPRQANRYTGNNPASNPGNPLSNSGNPAWNPPTPFPPTPPATQQPWQANRYTDNNPASNPGNPAWNPPTPFPPTPPATQEPWQANRYTGNPGNPIWNPPTPFPPTSPNAQESWQAANNLPGNSGRPAWATTAEPLQPPVGQPEAPRKSRRPLAIVIIILIVLVLLGTGGYLALSGTGNSLPHLGQTATTPIKTTNLNIPLLYAGMNVTLLSAQQSQTFTDDPHTASNGMLRLRLQEQNKTGITINWDYNTIARLIVPGSAAFVPTYVQSSNSIAPGATLNSIVDFTIANGGDLSKTTLLLGATKEAKIQIPLTGQANLNQYLPRTTTQNGTMLYFGLNWTLTSSTTSLSIAGQQATSGSEYLTLNLTVDSTLAQQTITGSPFDYMNLQIGSKTILPIGTTLPVSFAGGETGKTGTATFLIPQKSTACSLILLSQDPGGAGQASTNFQIG